MKFSHTFWMVALGAIVFSSLMIGCGGKKENEDDDIPRKKTRSGGAAVSTASLKAVKATKFGVIKGKISWQGDPPASDALTEALRKEIAGNPDHDYCMKGRLPSDPADFKTDIKSFETTEQEFRLGKNGGLGNVFVWIQPENGYYFEIPKDQLDGIEKEVVLNQPHCSFLPHCAVVFPSYYKDGTQVKTGQKLFVENDARVTHNAKIKGGPRNGESNQTLQPRKGETTSRLEVVFKPEKDPISISCDIHKWMKAYVRALDHPYAAVTSVGADLPKKVWENLDSAKVGEYEIKGVPVGAKVQLFVWHERAGFLTPPKGETITLQETNEKSYTAGPSNLK